MAKIGRLLTAMVTPFDEEGKIDYGKAKKLAVALLNSGSDGVVVAATTGESPTLEWDEHLRLFEEVKSAVGDRGTVVGYTGSNSTREALKATREAERSKSIDACLLVVPYYNKPDQDGLFEHFSTIAQSTTLPCVLYNVPSRTITNMAAETVIRLSQIKNIIGIKEASGDLTQIAQIIHSTRPDFLVWSGNDGDIYPILTLGGYGVISVASHLVGRQIKMMIDGYRGGAVKMAKDLHLSLLPLFKALFLASNPVPVKYALNQIGFLVGKTRLPLTGPSEKVATQIMEVVRKYRIDLSVEGGN